MGDMSEPGRASKRPKGAVPLVEILFGLTSVVVVTVLILLLLWWGVPPLLLILAGALACAAGVAALWRRRGRNADHEGRGV